MNPSYCIHANLCGNTAFETTVDFINYSLIVCVYIYIRVDAHLFSKQLQNDFLFCFCLYCSAMSSISFKTGFSFSKQIFQQMYVKIMVQTVQPVSCTAPLAVSKKKGQTQEKRVERRGGVCARSRLRERARSILAAKAQNVPFFFFFFLLFVILFSLSPRLLATRLPGELHQKRGRANVGPSPPFFRGPVLRWLVLSFSILVLLKSMAFFFFWSSIVH